jgi:hypothetical protein
LIESNTPAPPKELRELVLTQLARNNKTNLAEESVVEEPCEEYVTEGTRKGKKVIFVNHWDMSCHFGQGVSWEVILICSGQWNFTKDIK